MYEVQAVHNVSLSLAQYSCWIRDTRVLYGVNICYFTIIFLFNLAILITVCRQIFKLRHVGNRHDKMPVWKDAGTVLGLMCLVGITWGLAFFSSGYTSYTILYLFCILNTLQGRFTRGTQNKLWVNDILECS